VSEAHEDEFPALLTVREVARLLRLSRATVYALIELLELPSIRFTTNAIRVRADDLQDYLRARPCRRS